MIRQATREDAGQAAPLFIPAMGHIAGLLAGSDHYEDAIPLLEQLFRQDDNQYSYSNTLVYQEGTQIIGFAVGYDGALLHKLRKPVLDEVHKKQPDFAPDDETEAGEFYLDCVSVDEHSQGKGIGKKLIMAFCDRAKSLGYDRVGLIVDLENPDARKIYEKLGFETLREKKFLGHKYFHMVRTNSKT
jgi:ribosomal protein S18 acetylase RimI-like enzyme